MEELAQLTVLESLTLRAPHYPEGTTCSHSALQRLTSLWLDIADDEDLHAFVGCTGLRELSLMDGATIIASINDMHV
jgi:hypothetical protein